MRTELWPKCKSKISSPSDILIHYERYAVDRASLKLAQKEFRCALSMGLCREAERLVNDANQLLRIACAKKSL